MVLARASVLSKVETELSLVGFGFLSSCVSVLSLAAQPAKDQYVELVIKRFRIMFQRQGSDVEGYAGVVAGVSTLSLHAPRALDIVQDEHGAASFARLITVNVSKLRSLFRVLQYFTPTFQEMFINALGEDAVAELVDRVISTGRSTETLGVQMRELRMSNPGLLAQLEQAIGALQFLRLIVSSGTLIGLFRVLVNATSVFRSALLKALDQAAVAELVDKTIAAGCSIGTLNLYMLDLGKAEPGALVQLEKNIGAAQFLRLVETSGNLTQFFVLLQRSTPIFRAQLVDELNERVAAILVVKTIAAGQSIESLHYMMNSLSRTTESRNKLESCIGIAGWWRLIKRTGTLNTLSNIARSMSDEFRERFIRASAQLGVDDWEEIICRGLFCNACMFVEKELTAYPLACHSAFNVGLAQAALPLALAASWFDLNTSQVEGDIARSEWQILRKALQLRVSGVDPKALHGLDFREAIHGLVFAWNERTDLRPVLASQFWQIIPDISEWPDKKSEVAALRFVAIIARSDLVSETDARRLLDSTISFLTPKVCAEMHTLPLFLLFWNLVALEYERGLEQRFDNLLVANMQIMLMEVLRERVKPRGANSEKNAQLALAGLLLLLNASLRDKLGSILAPISGAIEWLQREALDDQMGFIPALFTLNGISLLKPPEAVFAKSTCAVLVAKAGDYADIGSAVEHLLERLRRL